MATRLLQPLGVTSAGWGPTTVAGGNDQPVGHNRVGGAWVPCEGCDNSRGLSAAGTMHISLGGWARIIQELLLADQGRSALLSQATARTLTTNAVPPGGGANYGLGWGITNPTPGARLVTHDGSNTFNHARATVALDAGGVPDDHQRGGTAGYYRECTDRHERTTERLLGHWSLEQATGESRDLNEPVSNVHGGLGVFSAFSADTAAFSVVK